MMNDFFSNRETQNFKGSPITMKVRDADIKDVLRLVGETSGFNIVVGEFCMLFISRGVFIFFYYPFLLLFVSRYRLNERNEQFVEFRIYSTNLFL